MGSAASASASASASTICGRILLLLLLVIRRSRRRRDRCRGGSGSGHRRGTCPALPSAQQPNTPPSHRKRDALAQQWRSATALARAAGSTSQLTFDPPPFLPPLAAGGAALPVVAVGFVVAGAATTAATGFFGASATAASRRTGGAGARVSRLAGRCVAVAAAFPPPLLTDAVFRASVTPTGAPYALRYTAAHTRATVAQPARVDKPARRQPQNVTAAHCACEHASPVGGSHARTTSN
jgi:hypothetical protein